ncbi:MAG: hydantoinase/oxoprolinase family protein [Candidatus Obscuribacterales bacterium]|nr:hydantoinase/oxoprolinase family protein [Candidatus Obscuribacterales bacterium]
MKRTVRIGIDVGGTFTHAVALDGDTLQLCGKTKVPTTHNAKDGVARGIIDALHALLQKENIPPEAVTFIAHSTTQATNALLEGDVAEVGILALGKGASAWLTRWSCDIGAIELAKDKFLKTHFEFVDSGAGLDQSKLQSAMEKLVAKGAQVIAISDAFSVDNPLHEETALAVAQKLGLMATAGSQVSKLYGLRVRTLTAVINAAMLPKMIETANMTESSVRAAGITAPIMIMRSDGGVMDIEAMRQRPILTRLSGPAAGVAAAMMYLRISDGIFLEVGGTSTDISVIKNGKALVKDAEIGGHRVYLRSLDVHTLGVAGGSMIRLKGRNVTHVGPRSAHIAGLNYVSFAPDLSGATLEHISPKAGDPADYIAIATSAEQKKATITPTCAANLLHFVPPADCAFANQSSLKQGFAVLEKATGAKSEEIAEQILNHAYETCLPTIKRLIAEYKLDPENLTLVGGGGGAAAIVPYIAKRMGAEHLLAQEADVISAIGVALALLRETVERQVIQPKQEDLVRIREEAFNAVSKMGADPASIEVHVEVDPRANILRATAYGATALHKTASAVPPNPEEKLAIVATSFKREPATVKLLVQSDHFQVYGCEGKESKLFGLLSSSRLSLRVMDNKGVIRSKIKHGAWRQSKALEAENAIMELADTYSVYGDAGKIIPDFMLVAGARIIDLSGLLDTWQVQALARSELSQIAPDSEIIILASLP